MFDEDIQHLRAVLQKVRATEATNPEKRHHLKQAYGGLMQAIAALEQMPSTIPSLHISGEPVADLYEAITQEERLRELL